MAMPRSRRKFDIDEFVRECLQAWETEGADAVKDVLDRTLGRGCAPVRECFGDPREAHLQVLYPGPELVIENMVWAPGMSYPAHNHNTPVMTGVYAGLEVNDFYQAQPAPGGRLQRTETVDINEGEAVLMAHDAIHRIANPNRRTFTGAFHIYMGDYLHSSRSIWYPDEASETPASFALTKDIFAAANRDLVASRALEADQDPPKKKSTGPTGTTGPGSAGPPSGPSAGHTHGPSHPPHAPARGPWSRRGSRAPLHAPDDRHES
jgi:predicted metal-dependent enzyme (double-stranded beta helix superfamily)